MTDSKVDLCGRSVLFIAYFYPPVSATGVPGAMRTVKFIRYLNNGNCHVLTVPPTLEAEQSALSHISLPVNGEQIHQVQPRDLFQLLLGMRAGIKRILTKRAAGTETNAGSSTSVFRSSSQNDEKSIGTFQRLKDFIYNLCYFPDQAGPWIMPAVAAGKRLIKENGIDVIFATGSPWSSLLIGYLISKATGKPLIVDFRDPWIDNPFHQSKGTLLDRRSQVLERKVVYHASAISLNTDALRDQFLNRYPKIPESRFFVMPNGFDESEFESLTPTQPDGNTETLQLCHAGFLYGVRDPSTLLEAIRKANQTNHLEGIGIQFRQIGNINLEYDIRDRYKDLIDNGSLIIDPPMPYNKCLEALQTADIVVNIQPGTETQVPSKLYDYLALNKPILNITPKGGALGRLATKFALGEVFDFDQIDKITAYLVSQRANKSKIEEFNGYPNKDSFNIKLITQSLNERILALTK